MRGVGMVLGIGSRQSCCRFGTQDWVVTIINRCYSLIPGPPAPESCCLPTTFPYLERSFEYFPWIRMARVGLTASCAEFMFFAFPPRTLRESVAESPFRMAHRLRTFSCSCSAFHLRRRALVLLGHKRTS